MKQYISSTPPSELDKYRGDLAHLGWSYERETSFLQALHQVMQSFVDRAFGDDSVQLVLAGERSRISDDRDDMPVIESERTSTQKISARPDYARASRKDHRVRKDSI